MEERAGSTGLVIGKFMPPHAGHRQLIETARRSVERLTVILFSKASVRGLPFVPLSGTPYERLSAASAAIDALLGKS